MIRTPRGPSGYGLPRRMLNVLSNVRAPGKTSPPGVPAGENGIPA